MTDAENNQNAVMIDWRENPDLRAAFSGKKVGDTCSFETKLVVTEITEDGMKGTIKSIAPEGYEPPVNPTAAASEDGVLPDTKTPVAVLIARGSK